MKLSVLVPIYNEDKSFISLLQRVAAVPVEKEIIVVDDGSAHSIEDAIKQAAIPNVRFFQHGTNRGKGAAIRTALEEATGDIVIIQDADFEYYPEDYLPLIQAYEKNAVNVVYGVRNLSKRSLIMRWGNIFVTWLTNLLYGSSLEDMETCYKLVDIQLLRSLDLSSNRFEIEAEISAKLLKLKEPIVEIPIRYNHREEGKKLSPMDGFPTVLTLLKCLFWKPERPFEK